MFFCFQRKGVTSVGLWVPNAPLLPIWMSQLQAGLEETSKHSRKLSYKKSYWCTLYQLAQGKKPEPRWVHPRGKIHFMGPHKQEGHSSQVQNSLILSNHTGMACSESALTWPCFQGSHISFAATEPFLNIPSEMFLYASGISTAHRRKFAGKVNHSKRKKCEGPHNCLLIDLCSHRVSEGRWKGMECLHGG